MSAHAQLAIQIRNLKLSGMLEHLDLRLMEAEQHDLAYTEFLSMILTDELETRTARKQHRCSNCGETIELGEQYQRWMSVDDGKAFSNKMHPECLESLQDGSGDFEYTLYGGERPEIVTPNA